MITEAKMHYFEYLEMHGTETGFEPDEIADEDWEPTEALPGTAEKLDKMAERLEAGLPLWHPQDRTDFRYLSEIFRPTARLRSYCPRQREKASSK